VNDANYTTAEIIYTCYTSDFITDMTNSSLQVRLLKAEVVKARGDHTERKGTTATTIPKSLQCSYNTKFTFTVIKNAEETNNCNIAQKF
jgi:hypothetical protein